MIEIQNKEYWKKLFEEEIQILTPQEVEEIKNTKIKEYTSSTIWRRWYFLAREKTKTIRMEEETISMTMEEDNNQYNPIEIKDNRIYNNYVMSIESEEDDDKDSTRVEAMLAEEKKRLEEEEKRFTKGEKKRLVGKEEENNKKEKRVKEIEEKVEEDMKEKEEMKKEIQIKDQTIKKLTKDIMALKKKHENEMSTKNHECDKKYSNSMLNLKGKGLK
ncbi:hypothetical protein ENUP19_0020G0035 [Entamoeba nuttalli]|uniref:Uncharacterized protein n=1 Tax=Entamoeba nuttalli TaxID=412467 RepID=A0ABQ0D8Y9_9EUKA